jgi:hypothetical protein
VVLSGTKRAFDRHAAKVGFEPNFVGFCKMRQVLKTPYKPSFRDAHGGFPLMNDADYGVVLHGLILSCAVGVHVLIVGFRAVEH